MVKVAFILSGLPGSGKSNVASALVKAHGGKRKCPVHSTDSFFLKGKGKRKRYKFDLGKLAENHAHNLAAFITSCGRGFPTVICDNTNLSAWEREPYVAAAKSHGYLVQVLTVGEFTDEALEAYAKRNSHGVSLDALKSMRSRWQR